MSTKLNQIIAVEKGIKSRANADVSDLYKAVQKSDLFNGLNKSYQPLDDNDQEKLPSENKRVQYQVPEVLKTLERNLTDLFSITARKDWTNTVAKGTVVVDGVPLVVDAPVSFLLFLEKQVTDVRTFVSNLPILDEAENWTLDPNTNYYKTAEIQTHRTKKVQRPIVLYDATANHPAQTQIITEDVIAGYWKLIKQSGAIPKTERQKLLDRVEKLLIGIKEAREAANGQEEVKTPDVADAVFGYLFPAK